MNTRRRNEQEWQDELICQYRTMMTEVLIELEASYRATIRLMELDGAPMAAIEATQTRLNAVVIVITERLHG
jgi:hypothetical protein